MNKNNNDLNDDLNNAFKSYAEDDLDGLYELKKDPKNIKVHILNGRYMVWKLGNDLDEDDINECTK